MAAAILLFCFQGAGRKLSTECRPSAEKVWGLGAKGTKEQGFAGVCAPSRRQPSAEKARRLGAKGTKEQGFAGVCAPSRRRPSAEKVRRLGAKGTKEQGFAGVRAPTPGRKIGKGGPDTGRVGAPLSAKPCASVARRQHLALRHRPCWRPSSRPPKNNKKTSNLSCSSMVRDQGFEPWTP